MSLLLYAIFYSQPQGEIPSGCVMGINRFLKERSVVMSSSLFERPFARPANHLPFFRLKLPLQIRATCIVLLLMLVSFLVGWIALCSRHKYLPLAGLGTFYGAVLAYPVTRLFGPRLQSALGGVLGGFSMGNMVHRINHTASSIEFIAKAIATTVQQVLVALGVAIEADFLVDGVLLCLSMTIVTMLLIIITSAYGEYCCRL